MLSTHHTPLPSQVTLLVTNNKVQLITIICQLLKSSLSQLSMPETHALVVTDQNPVNGVVTEQYLRTNHEEADGIIVQLTRDETTLIDVDVMTNIFVLFVHFFSEENLTCHLLMAGTGSERKLVDTKATADLLIFLTIY